MGSRSVLKTVAGSKGASKLARAKNAGAGLSERLASGEGKQVAPFFAAMPIEDLRALVAEASREAKGTRATTLTERASRAAALATEIVHAARFFPDHDPDDPRLLIAIEALEGAIQHYYHPELQRFRRVSEAIDALEYARELLAKGETLDEVVGVIIRWHAPRVSIDDAKDATEQRWRSAIRDWRGEVSAAPGRPKKGASVYRWHRVVYALLHGRVQEPEATQLRDNYAKWKLR